MDDMVTDYWAHHYSAGGSKDEVEDTEFDVEAELEKMKRESEGEGDWEEVKFEP